MPDLRSFVEQIHYQNRREYSHIEGNVAYLDGSPLTRPLKMPMVQRSIALIIFIAAVIIGLVIVNNLVIARWTESANSEQAITANLARTPSIDTVPQVASLINLDNDSIRARFEEAGYTIYDASSDDGSESMVLYKLPDDVSLSEAAAMYLKGVGSLNAEQASRLLNGSWYFAAERVNGTSMVVRYADFSTGDPEIAVQDAIVKEGIDATTVTDSGVDESGNTYTMGDIDVDGTHCSWKVSALELDEMYSIAGLPENSCYVGIRITVA